MNHFLFMYPIKKILDVEINIKHDLTEDCMKIMNECILKRYRLNNFLINYAVFDDSNVSNLMAWSNEDNIIHVGITSEEHFKSKKYPSEDYILSHLENPEKLVVAGFHMWDCIERIAKKAYEKGIDTLVDEDLTEFFFSKRELKAREFMENLDKYPTYNPYTDPEASEGYIHDFMKARKGLPWLWQNYSKKGFVKEDRLKVKANRIIVH